MRRISALLALLFALLPQVAFAQSIEEKAQVCEACHGENGIPPEQSFPVPVIWGQNLGYLLFQLRDFKSGARQNEQMTPIAQGLEHEELIQLAQYFSKKAWPKLPEPPAADDVASKASRISASIGCTGCHREGFHGDGMLPRLAGQVRVYLEKTMTDFRSGTRAANPGMSDLMRARECDIEVLAAFLAGL
jgi:cytochrome c553